ncbi:hypothetical protein GCM10010447_52780 [Streptomyces fulvorobeus]
MVAGCGAEVCPVNGSGVKPSVRRAQGGASVIHSPIAASDFAPGRTAAATAQTSALKG